MNNIFYPILCLLLFLFMPHQTYAQEVKKVEFKSIKQQPIIRKQNNNSITRSKTVVPVERKSHSFTPVSASNNPRVVHAKERISPTQTTEYWDFYIEETEKKIADLEQGDPNYAAFKEKLEKSLENAKIRKALINQ